ncbi:MAG: hypothetical protein AB7P03_22730 [Kofleriaceae bacterium]
MQVRCDHCNNPMYAAEGDTGIVDEAVKRAGWRRRDAPAKRPVDDIDVEVADELRELGLEVDDNEVADWLTEDAVPPRRAPLNLDVVADWLEEKEAALTPLRADVVEALTSSTVVRGDIAWRRTADGLVVCSGHCYEHLSRCDRCGMNRSSDAHRGCAGYLPPCKDHTGRIVQFPR